MGAQEQNLTEAVNNIEKQCDAEATNNLCSGFLVTLEGEELPISNSMINSALSSAECVSMGQ